MASSSTRTSPRRRAQRADALAGIAVLSGQRPAASCRAHVEIIATDRIAEAVAALREVPEALPAVRYGRLILFRNDARCLAKPSGVKIMYDWW